MIVWGLRLGATVALSLLAGVPSTCGSLTALPDAVVTATAIVTAAEKLAAWQKSTVGDVTAFLAPDTLDTFIFRRTVNPRGWVHAAFLIGLKDWARATDNEGHWLWLKEFAEAQEFMLAERQYHADDQAVAQYYLALSDHYSLPQAIAPTRERFQFVINNPSSVSLNHTTRASQADRDRDYQRACQFRWCWSDALYMAPPGYFMLTAATGDPAFADFAHAEFWATTDYLFEDLPGVAAGSGLLYRDSRFFEERDANGGLIFWSRGNGYEGLFKKMAKAIKATQVTSGEYRGFWGPSLLAYDLYPFPESSGTGFFVGGLCWGIRTGLLAPEDYVDAAVAGWKALVSVQEADGRIGWVQQIGSAPEEVRRGVTQMYGSGAFLQAAAGMLGLHDGGYIILNELRGPLPGAGTAGGGSRGFQA